MPLLRPYANDPQRRHATDLDVSIYWPSVNYSSRRIPGTSSIFCSAFCRRVFLPYQSHFTPPSNSEMLPGPKIEEVRMPYSYPYLHHISALSREIVYVTVSKATVTLPQMDSLHVHFIVRSPHGLGYFGGAGIDN